MEPRIRNKKVLVIAPHPDDEVLGCGGTIAKLAKNNNVSLCIVTKAYTPNWSKKFILNRPKEVKKASKILGIKNNIFLGLPTLKLNTFPQNEINQIILKEILIIKPEIVFIPHKGDANKDHQVIYDSCLVACRPISNKINKILSYEVLSSTEWGSKDQYFVPNVYSDITNTLKKKFLAMKIYKSELKKTPHPRSLEIIEALAKKRGSEIGVKYAEAFMLIRESL